MTFTTRSASEEGNENSSDDSSVKDIDFDDLNDWTIEGPVSISDNGYNGSCMVLDAQNYQVASASKNIDWTNVDKIGFWYKASAMSSLFVTIGGDSDENAIFGQMFSSDVDWTYYEYNTTSINGSADLKLFSTLGLINIDSMTFTLKSNDSYSNCDNSTLVVTSVSVVSSDVGVVVISVKDVNGTPVSGVNITYTINNAEAVTKSSDSNGQVIVSDLTGEVTVYASFAGNANYLASNNTGIFNFTTSSETNTTNNTTGNNTAGNTTNGTSGNTTGDNSTPVVTKVDTKISATAVKMVYNTGKAMTITLKDNNGKLIANAKITIILNGKTITKNTDKNGQVKLTISLVPKTYTAKVSYAGDETYKGSSTTAKITVTKATPKLTVAKKKTFKVKTKTKKVTATLKDNKGKVLKNTKVTLKVKGKTYTAKTNKKGVATFKVTKLTKKGTFKATVKYAGNNKFKAISKTVKIIVKK